MFFLRFVCVLAPVLGDDWATPLEKTAKISSDELLKLGKHISMNAAAAENPSRGGIDALLSTEGQHTACPHCARKDYSDACPLGWTQYDDGSCGAPSAYKGLCNKTQTFALSSVSEKKESEIDCDVCWPCAASDDETSTCIRNWALPCPNGYSPQDISYDTFSAAEGVTCTPDYSYEGQCEPQTIFKDLQSKYDFAVRCKTSWPCANTCTDISPCPADWEPIGDGLCLAPASFKAVDCPLLASFRGWTREVKENFAQKCGVEWACVTEAAKLEMDCELDLSTCPRHWIEKGSLCAPSIDAHGACAKSVNAKSMSTEEKLTWASKCGLEWPCLGESNENSLDDQPRDILQMETSAAGPINNLGQIVIP